MTRPLRIGVVCLHTDPFAPPGSGDVGGMNVVVRSTAVAMAAAGHEVTVWTRLASATAPTTETIDGVLLRRLPAGPATTLLKSAHDDLVEPFGRLLREEPPVDVLHSHHWFSGMAALEVARERGVPHVQSFHSVAAPPDQPLTAGEPPESPARLDGETLLARRTDIVVAVSAADRGVGDRTDHEILQGLDVLGVDDLRIDLHGHDLARALHRRRDETTAGLAGDLRLRHLVLRSHELLLHLLGLSEELLHVGHSTTGLHGTSFLHVCDASLVAAHRGRHRRRGRRNRAQSTSFFRFSSICCWIFFRPSGANVFSKKPLTPPVPFHCVSTTTVEPVPFGTTL